MKSKLPIILMFVIVAAAGFGAYYVITHVINKPAETGSSVSASGSSESSSQTFDEKIADASANGYKDPDKRYWLLPPEKWQLVDKDLMLKAGTEALPSNLKDWVKPDNVDVMFMDLSTPNQFGSNLNIISLNPSYGLEINDTTFPQLKDQIVEQYNKMNLTNFRLIDSKILELLGRNCGYFELSFELMGNNLRTIQVIIPGNTAAVILTYTLNAQVYDSVFGKKIEDSYKTYIPNEEKGF
jgi:hypothetical protein